MPASFHLMKSFVIRGQKVVLPDRVGPASLKIEAGKIAAIAAYEQIWQECDLIEIAPTDVLMAGLVDTHVHINSPGRTEWEGFESATRAAAAGGVTTLVDMPLNSIPPTTAVSNFHRKLQTARQQCYVDTGFWGGVISEDIGALAPLIDAGVVGFKCFLVPSGVNEFPHVTESELTKVMPELSRLGALLIVHAELPAPIANAVENQDGPPSAYGTFLSCRPAAAENEAVSLMIDMTRRFRTSVHIVHLSSAEAVPMLRNAQAEGLHITAETCPHYLYFAAEDVPDGATEFKCCPPIRERANREKLWSALADGTIDMIVSDHSPCPPQMKQPESGNFLEAWGGISSLQLRLPIVWTEARRRGHSICQLAHWLCKRPAELVGFDKSKGTIQIGRDADLVIWNPETDFVVRPDALLHRHKITPYAGKRLYGVVKKTFLRGRKIYDEGAFLTRTTGTLLFPNELY
ncbi:MAG: allantoinase AllB [Pyrinomonadaceae bacterium]